MKTQTQIIRESLESMKIGACTSKWDVLVWRVGADKWIAHKDRIRIIDVGTDLEDTITTIEHAMSADIYCKLAS